MTDADDKPRGAKRDDVVIIEVHDDGETRRLLERHERRIPALLDAPGRRPRLLDALLLAAAAAPPTLGGLTLPPLPLPPLRPHATRGWEREPNRHEREAIAAAEAKRERRRRKRGGSNV